jgi:hypothetical protein
MQHHISEEQKPQYLLCYVSFPGSCNKKNSVLEILHAKKHKLREHSIFLLIIFSTYSEDYAMSKMEFK